MDRTSSEDPEVIDRMLTTHFLKLRRTPTYSKAVFRIAHEANLSQVDSNRTKKLISGPQFGDVQWVYKDPTKENRVGVWTTNETKNAFKAELQRNLPLMHIAEDYLTQSRSDNCCIPELCKQLKNYRVDLKEKANGGGMTSLVTGKGVGKKDDLSTGTGLWLHYMFMAILHDIVFQQFLETNKLVVA